MDDRQGFGGQERFCFESPKEANTQDSRCLATTFFLRNSQKGPKDGASSIKSQIDAR